MARTRLAAGLLLCVALAFATSTRAEEAEAVVTVTDADSFDKLIKVCNYMVQLGSNGWQRAGSHAKHHQPYHIAAAACLLHCVSRFASWIQQYSRHAS
jgi:hypothetical protein